jgi:hypothetical protein
MIICHDGTGEYCLTEDYLNLKRELAEARAKLVVAQRLINAAREYPCGHKPSHESGPCEVCRALEEWEQLFAEATL